MVTQAGRPGSIHRPLQQRKGAVVKPEVEEMKRLRATVAEQQTTIQQLTDRLDSGQIILKHIRVFCTINYVSDKLDAFREPETRNYIDNMCMQCE